MLKKTFRLLGLTLLVLVIVAGAWALTAWTGMLVMGGVFAIHHWHTPGFWETAGIAWLIAWAGGLWSQTRNLIQKIR